MSRGELHEGICNSPFPSSKPSDIIKSVISDFSALLDKKLVSMEETLCESEIGRLKAVVKMQCKHGTQIRYTALTHCTRSETDGKAGATNGTNSQDV
jgi:hypothetical protein